jgi:hypothetical protein
LNGISFKLPSPLHWKGAAHRRIEFPIAVCLQHFEGLFYFLLAFNAASPML